MAFQYPTLILLAPAPRIHVRGWDPKSGSRLGRGQVLQPGDSPMQPGDNRCNLLPRCHAVPFRCHPSAKECPQTGTSKTFHQERGRNKGSQLRVTKRVIRRWPFGPKRLGPKGPWMLALGAPWALETLGPLWALCLGSLPQPNPPCCSGRAPTGPRDQKQPSGDQNDPLENQSESQICPPHRTKSGPPHRT